MDGRRRPLSPDHAGVVRRGCALGARGDRRGRRAPRLLDLRLAAVRSRRPGPAAATDGAAGARRLQRGGAARLGARMIAHVLSERGWTVMLLGADTPAAAWPQIVRARRPDIAVLSTTTVAVLGRVGPSLHAIKTARPECRTVIGGQAYSRLSNPSVNFGADLVALDARTLPQRLLEST